MRVVISTILILVLFLISTFLLNQYIDRSCEKLLDDIDVLNKLIKEENWDQAKQKLEDLKKHWKHIKKGWQLFLEHYEMDAIDIALVRLEQYVQVEEKVLSLGEMSELRLLVAHIKDKEKLKLESIL